MNDAEAQVSERLVRRFFSQLYDEWITGVSRAEAPTVNACTCRALSAAIGGEVFESVLQSLAEDQRIEMLCGFAEAEPDAAVIKLLDYSV